MDKDEIFDAWEQELVWLIGKAGGVNALARELEVSPSSISYWLSRKRMPSPQQALNIEAYTEGKISREVIRPDIYPTTVLLKTKRSISGFKAKEYDKNKG